MNAHDLPGLIAALALALIVTIGCVIAYWREQRNR